MKQKLPKTLRGRFFLTTISLMLIIGIGASTLSYLFFTDNLRSNAIHATETNLQFIRNEINSHLSNVKKLCHWSQTNTDIAAYLQTNPESAGYSTLTKQAANALTEEYISNPSAKYISRIVIANEDSSRFLQKVYTTQYSADRQMVEFIKSLPYYNHLMESGLCTFDIGVQDDFFNPRHGKMLPVIQPVYHTYNSASIGISFMQLSFSLFTDPLVSFSLQEKQTVFVTICKETYRIDGHDISPAAQAKDPVQLSDDGLAGNDTILTRVSSKDSTVTYVSSPLDAEGCYISIPVSARLMSHSGMRYLAAVAFILLFTCFIGIFLLLMLSHSVTMPIEQLKNRITSVAKGNFEKDASIEWENELGEIGRYINQLASDIDHLMEQRIRYERQKKDYEYQMLQSQINPHFMYNTLNSIKWMANAQHADGIAEMTTALAHLLKSIAKGTSSVITLEQEMKLLDDYFVIQKYRYGGSITMEYRIDDKNLLHCPILRFTLQPIVENAIFHGIEPKGQNGQIEIHIFAASEDCLQIDITDNGIGMTQEMIEKVLSEETPDSSDFFQKIGIGNVHKRIQYNFGRQYGIHITAEPGVYTCMTLLLPLDCPYAAEHLNTQE